jgi:HEAT repeats
MKRLQAALFLVIVLGFTAQAPGQWMFAKKVKVNPLQRVPELILIVKTDADEKKRQHAAEELREYDTTTFAEIVPVLADVLKSDKKPGVRSEALSSLVKIRPATPMAAQAIEKAAAEDDTLRIRLTAKAALPKYHVVLSLTKKGEPPATNKKATTNEPPLLAPSISSSPPLPSANADFPRPMPPGVAAPAKKVEDGPSLFPEK